MQFCAILVRQRELKHKILICRLYNFKHKAELSQTKKYTNKQLFFKCYGFMYFFRRKFDHKIKVQNGQQGTAKDQMGTQLLDGITALVSDGAVY